MAHVRPHRHRIAVIFKVDGKTRQTTINVRPTKAGIASAERQARKAEHRLRSGESWEAIRAWLRGERVTAARSLGYYAQHLLEFAEVERSTLMGYETIYNRYWLPFDAEPIDKLTRTALEQHLATFPVGRKTRKNAVSVLRQIFAIAKRDKVIADAPTDEWEVKKATSPEPDPYSEAEREGLLTALEAWPIAWRYFLLAFHSGMRTGELLGLEWQTVAEPSINITQTRVRRRIKPSTKTSDHRRVLLPPVVWEMLKENPTRFRQSFVFLTPEHRPFLDADWLMDKWAKAHRKANVRRRHGLYPWRSTYISLGLASGQSPIWMSKQTGHDMITMNNHYARWIKGREDADLAELAKVYEK